MTDKLLNKDGLSYYTGKVKEITNDLSDRIDNISSLGRYLSTWICPTGLAGTNPPHSPFEYRSGDYFLVSYVAQAGQTNYRPSGTTYTTGVASTVVETDTVVAGDRYLYDGTQWILQKVAERSISFNNVVGSPYDNTNLAAALNGKQALIDAQHKLNSDLVSDADQTNKFVTAQEKTTWNNKQNAISDLDDIRSGASAGATALQSGDNVTELVNNAGYLTGITGQQVTNALGYTPYNSTNPDGYQNATQVNTAITSYHDTSKQDTLVSGTNIKTVNNNSLVGSGNVSINEITSAERTKLGTINTIFTKIGGSDIDYDLSTIECSKESQTYGFEYGTYTYGGSSFTGLGSQNYHVANSFSYGKINFTFAKAGILKVTAYCSGESTYDFGILSNLDQELSKDATADTTNKYSFSGHQKTTYVAEYEVTAGNHFITIKYKKDGSQDTDLDRMVITKIEFKTQHGFFVASYENPSEQIEIGNTPEVDYPVTDVQMQNSTSATTYTSILDGKIAKIPKATTSVMGVVRPSNTYGTTITSGYLGIYSATAAQTQSKSSTSVPLTPARIHDIIKYGLGGYSGTAFTDAEKQKARQTIGVDDAGAKITFVEWT
ncbi:MAG: hypothetical protein KBT03_09575 [Bacteroidales bacterium]|nr:hypothetical protein [Candidatus Scybalousia scybalohippi]